MSNEDALIQEILRIYNVDLDNGVITHKLSRGRGKAGDEAGTPHPGGYRRLRVCGKHFLSHRVLWLVRYGKWPAHHLDHINGVKTDNRLENLRECTDAENQQNRVASKKSTTGLMGVTTHRSGRYQAQITVGGRHIYLGIHETPELAHAAYLSAKKSLHVFNPELRTI